MLKPFTGEKFQVPSKWGPRMAVFLGKMGVETLDFGFATPKKALACAEPRRLTSLASKSVHASRL